MKKNSFILFILILYAFPAIAGTPSKHLNLLPFVQPAPDQGRSGTCLYVASTGAMELIANKKHGIRQPKAYGEFDLSESFLIHQKNALGSEDKLFIEKAILRFNWGYGIPASEWDFDVWRGSTSSRRVWNERDWTGMTKIQLPKVETIPLFAMGDRWTTNVLDESHIQKIKEALWQYNAPVMINYKDKGYWHVVLIIGYDDDVPGKCYQITESDCGLRKGAFFVRDSFGLAVDLRDYDWLRVKGNHAIIVKEVE